MSADLKRHIIDLEMERLQNWVDFILDQKQEREVRKVFKVLHEMDKMNREDFFTFFDNGGACGHLRKWNTGRFRTAKRRCFIEVCIVKRGQL